MFAFFKAASERKIIDGAAVAQLLSTISLKNQHGAACLAIVIQNDPSHSNVKPQILVLAQSKGKEEQIKGIICLGEIGKLIDLSSETQILELILKNFQSPEDDIRQASSISLGNLTIGNPKFFLDKVFNLVNQVGPQ